MNMRKKLRIASPIAPIVKRNGHGDGGSGSVAGVQSQEVPAGVLLALEPFWLIVLPALKTGFLAIQSPIVWLTATYRFLIVAE